MSRERYLDGAFIELAESVRSKGEFKLAALIAADGLRIRNKELTADEVANLASDPNQRAVLAGLARIYVDSLKTEANKAKGPREVLSLLGPASNIIRQVYQHQIFWSSIKGVEKDYAGRRHLFGAEMPRDWSKTNQVAALALDFRRGRRLEREGEELLRGTFDQLPEDHPTRPLIAIELNLMKAVRTGKLSREVLLDFEKLKEYELEDNPHRVATVAAWLAVWGERTNQYDIRETGQKEYEPLVARNPEWGHMIDNERQKAATQARKRITFPLRAYFLGAREQQNNLYDNLKKRSVS